jgi:cyclohexanone monooxygenase
MTTSDQQAIPGKVDVLIVGAGFAGLYLIHRIRPLGLSVVALEAGSGVGGTWYWNRYPGARCDVESMQYSFSVFPDLQQDWQWSELFAGQPEILKYANHVADRFDLRRSVCMNTRVVAAHFDDDAHQWTVQTEQGVAVEARWVVMATGCLSTARMPEFDGFDAYEGETYHTGHWPHESVDFSGQRVGIIGTGSSAIQAIPVIAKQAAHLTVFQRTSNYSIPSRNAPMPSSYEAEWKASYDERRDQARWARTGIVMERNDVGAMDVDSQERERIYQERWAAGGTQFMVAFNDLALNAKANDTAAEFVRHQIRATVNDTKTAELLVPTDYPIGTKRICVDTNYFETFNRANVSLVSIKDEPIKCMTQKGLTAGSKDYAFDSIVFATGFDAMTGTLSRIDIRGRRREKLTDKWEAGPRTYLGLAMHGFPNMFMVTGPGSPSVLSNMIVSIEQHVDWITDCIDFMRARELSCIEAERDAEDRWVDHVNEVAYMTLYPKAASWYMGANIPGKPRLFMPYIGGVGIYRDKCANVARDGYPGFRLASVLDRTAA